jgi:hypothetical protein
MWQFLFKSSVDLSSFEVFKKNMAHHGTEKSHDKHEGKGFGNA